MALLGKLVSLYTLGLALGQITYDERAFAPQQQLPLMMTYDQIAKIVQSPLFRNPEGTVPSYLPEKKSDSEESMGSPSIVLEVPKPGAVDSYAIHKETAQTFQPSPSQVKQYNSRQLDADYSLKSTQELPYKEYAPFNPHSKQLDLPLPSGYDDGSEYLPIPQTELQPPSYEAFNQYYTDPNQFATFKNSETPYISLTQELPKSESIKPVQLPTAVFPKKYNHKVHEQTPKKTVKIVPSVEIKVDESVVKKAEKLTPPMFEAVQFQKDKGEEKIRQKYEEQRRKKENELRKQKLKSEQIAESTSFNSFDAPIHQVGSVGLSDVAHGAGDDRTEFQMHGQHGPHSYKFGYDTGKGKNRQFRYEERDNDGYVKGHYGFYDKQGKLQVVNYDAHPHHGFHAEGSFGKA